MKKTSSRSTPKKATGRKATAPKRAAATDPDAYFKALPPERRAVMQELRAAIAKALPKGFEEVLVAYGNEYRLPIAITENGLADATDANRPRFLLEHLAAMFSAMQRGARVVGYYHWSTVDNFEWVGGYCPQFGLYTVDRNDPMRPRRARPSAALYRDVIRTGEITDAQLAMAPAYTRPARFCAATVSPMMDGGR